jgi:hypothetical protein
MERASKVIQTYIPHSEDTFRICANVINLIPGVLDLSNAISMHGKLTGGTRIASSTDAVFSGLVFIYHEDEMDAEQLGDLTRMYKTCGYKAEFRSQGHLAHKRGQAKAEQEAV